MRRSVWIFLAAILLPSLVLAWLAVRSARDQQVILEHQQAIICQDITDALAKRVQEQVDNSRAEFVRATDQLLQATRSPQALAASFNQRLHGAWNLVDVGFAVDLRGVIYSPKPQEGSEARTFRNENDRFLSNRENVEVFAQSTTKARSAPQILPPTETSRAEAEGGTAEESRPETRSESQNESNQLQRRGPQQGLPPSQSIAVQAAQPQQPAISQLQQPANSQLRQPANSQLRQPARNDSPRDQKSAPHSPSLNEIRSQIVQTPRQVEPRSGVGQSAISNTVPEESDFRRVIGSEASGALARFLEDKLRLIVWYRPNAGSMVFGAQIMQQRLINSLQPLIQLAEAQKRTDSTTSGSAYGLAILDDRGKVVASSRAGFTADWKHPFAATEIGEALPHWEVALYLLDPGQINSSASTLQLTLGLSVAVLVAAIVLGGWLMAVDVRRQLRLAHQKTDFVSNVSHELKTPLTSIRMFADLLADGRVNERDRQSNYLRIISAESARLTRLINNVLDFARMERGAPAGEPQPCDLVEIVREVVDTCRPHLESVGVKFAVEIRAEALPIVADRDSLAQIVLNLISNAEKYGGGDVLIRARSDEAAAVPRGCVEVLDRGPGIPPKKRETIFEPFQRLNDSLASGVSGSGLGLTLARRMARAHQGDVIYSPREGGGGCFTLMVPLSGNQTA